MKPTGGSKWPKVAVDSAGMGVRGQRIKRARERMGMTQLDVHKATEVGQRTIGRIEAGEAENSPKLEILEAFFGIGESATDGATDDLPAGRPPRPVIQLLTEAMELIAEATRQVASVEARTGERINGDPPRRVTWSTADAPSANRTQEGRGRPGRNAHGQ